MPSEENPQLSLVIVAHDMRREILRTIRSLSPGMQRDIQADDYEIIVVDNGSQEPVDREACARFGAQLRWLSFEQPSPSPVSAINWGLSQARAPLVGAMIDGARLASPGLLRHALIGERLHRRPVIATVGFHIGPDLQQRSVTAGYDRHAEDALLESVDWTSDGYRLFDISVFAGSSQGGWFRIPAESNALFLPKALWEQLGGYDERFQSPGGGLTNLDVFARACGLPDIRLIVLLGEATFHQMHGGVSTNNPKSRWDEFHGEYVRLRGRDFEVPKVSPLYLGGPAARAAATFEAPRSAKAAQPGAVRQRTDSPPLGKGESALARRYIELLKKALLNETALEAEAAYLLARDALESDKAFDDTVAYDMRSNASDFFRRVEQARVEGRYFDKMQRNIGFSHTMVGRSRLDNLDECVSTALGEDVPGDLVECGVWRGGAAILMRGILAAWNASDRAVWVADSFAGLPKPETPEDTIDLSADKRPELVVSQERVAANFALFDLLDAQVRFLPGWFKDTLPGAPIETIAVLRVDGDYYESTMTALTALYDRLSPGGFAIIDDYGRIPACRQAVDEFRAERDIADPIDVIDDTGICWRKPR